MQPFNPLNGHVNSAATGINIHGDVSGYSWNVNADTQPVLWSAGQTFDLDPFNRNIYSVATGVSDNRVVTGAISFPSAYHAFHWQNGTLTDLGDLGSSCHNSRGSGINKTGLIVGVATSAPCRDRAVTFQSGQPVPLGELPGGSESDAFDVNTSGKIVGWSGSSGGRRAVMWNPTVQDLNVSTFPAYPHGINDLDEIVGWIITAGGDRAFYWKDGVTTDLNDAIPKMSGWTLIRAYRINNLGQVVGYGTNPDGFTRGFLLTPICRPDFDGDGFVTGVDYDLYVAAFEAGDSSADFDDDGFISGIDFDLYVQTYEAGC